MASAGWTFDGAPGRAVARGSAAGRPAASGRRGRRGGRPPPPSPRRPRAPPGSRPSGPSRGRRRRPGGSSGRARSRAASPWRRCRRHRVRSRRQPRDRSAAGAPAGRRPRPPWRCDPWPAMVQAGQPGLAVVPGQGPASRGCGRALDWTGPRLDFELPRDGGTADAPDSKSGEGNLMGVRISLPGPRMPLASRSRRASPASREPRFGSRRGRPGGPSSSSVRNGRISRRLVWNDARRSRLTRPVRRYPPMGRAGLPFRRRATSPVRAPVRTSFVRAPAPGAPPRHAGMGRNPAPGAALPSGAPATGRGRRRERVPRRR